MQSMRDRNIEIDENLLNLVVGMTKEDPSKRYTLEQIKDHQWLKEEKATPEEMKSHFYQVTGRAEEEAKAMYTAN
jgi:serine/threonine protein kinase